MARDPDLAKWYKDKIADYIAKGYAVKLKPEEANTANDPLWYLPHFVTTHPNKDIREMYIRVSIIAKDQDAQRFQWRDPNRPADIYRMKAMISGSRSSPCSAQYVKNINADRFKETHPRAVEAIRDFFYVDDYVDCFDTEAEALTVTKAVVEINREAGFELRGLISNSRVLGLKWDPITDEFEFILRLDQIPKTIREGEARSTKNQALGIKMGIFDQFGYLANVMIRSKTIMRELWSLKIG